MKICYSFAHVPCSHQVNFRGVRHKLFANIFDILPVAVAAAVAINPSSHASKLTAMHNLRMSVRSTYTEWAIGRGRKGWHTCCTPWENTTELAKCNWSLMKVWWKQHRGRKITQFRHISWTNSTDAYIFRSNQVARDFFLYLFFSFNSSKLQ